jgi:hypothetical protein
MKRKRLCKPYSTQSRHTENFSLRALSGSLLSCSPSHTLEGRKCSGFCSSWLLFPFDDDRPVAFLVGYVRIRPTGVFALCKNRVRRQSPSSSQLGDVRSLHRSISAIRRTLLNRLGTGITFESGMGWSVVSDTGRHLDSSASPSSSQLAIGCNSEINRRIGTCRVYACSEEACA